MRVLRGHRGAVLCLAYSADGQTLATGGDDAGLCLWGPLTGELKARWPCPQPPALALAFSSTGLLAVAGHRTVHLIDLDDPEAGRSVQRGLGGSCSLAFSGDGRHIFYSGYLEGKIYGAHVPSMDGIVQRAGCPSGALALAHSPTDFLLAVGGGAPGRPDLALVPRAYGKARLDLTGHSQPVYALAFSRDGRRLASGSRDGTARVWEVANGRHVNAVCCHEGTVLSVAFSPDGDALLGAYDDGNVYLWDSATLDIRASFNWRIGGTRCVAFAPDGMTAAAAGADGSALVWDIDQ
jgi:hypothetical protein